MRNAIRLVVSDVDGTIVDDNKDILPGTVAAAARLKETGIPLTLVSSRPPRGMAALCKKLGLNGPVAAFNGGVIRLDGRTIIEHLIPEDAARQTLALFARRGIAAWLYAEEQWILNDPHGNYVPLERRTLGFDPIVIEDTGPYFSHCGKIVGVSNDFALLTGTEAELKKLLAGQAIAHRSQDYYLDVTHPEANKGAALQSLAAWYGIDLFEIVAIGDMTNDIPMFDVAGYSIAMGNAPAAVAAAAKARTGPNSGSGWADAIDRYILPTQGVAK